jgi:hypothetical protein
MCILRQQLGCCYYYYYYYYYYYINAFTALCWALAAFQFLTQTVGLFDKVLIAARPIPTHRTTQTE